MPGAFGTSSLASGSLPYRGERRASQIPGKHLYEHALFLDTVGPAPTSLNDNSDSAFQSVNTIDDHSIRHFGAQSHGLLTRYWLVAKPWPGGSLTHWVALRPFCSTLEELPDIQAFPGTLTTALCSHPLKAEGSAPLPVLAHCWTPIIHQPIWCPDQLPYIVRCGLSKLKTSHFLVYVTLTLPML